MIEISTKCSCGNIADYAVHDDAQRKCLLCMLEAVDVPIPVLVRTLDPWEREPVKPDLVDVTDE